MFATLMRPVFAGFATFKAQLLLGLAGLVAGLTAALILLNFVAHEFSYESFFPDAGSIYTVEERMALPGRPPSQSSKTPFALKAVLEQVFPSIRAATHLAVDELQQLRIRGGGDWLSLTGVAADEELFDVFRFPFVEGTGETAFDRPDAIVLTQSAAARLFGAAPAMGQTLTVERNPDRPLTVTGVIKDLPDNTHLKGDYFYRIHRQDWAAPAGRPDPLTDWQNLAARTYFRLSDGADIDAIQGRMQAFVADNLPSTLRETRPTEFIPLPLRDIHFWGTAELALKPPGNLNLVLGFAAVAGLILLIASFNFANLLLAIFSARRKEIALRKVVGARRRQLIGGLLKQVALLVCLAFAVSLWLAARLTPAFNALYRTALELRLTDNPLFLLMGLLLLALAVASAGLMPVLVASSVRPAKVLSGRGRAAPGHRLLRKALLTFQFAVAAGLIPLVAIVFAQIHFAETADTGFKRQGLLAIRGIIGADVRPHIDRVKREIEALPEVRSLATSLEAPGDNDVTFELGVERADGATAGSASHLKGAMVGFGYFETYGVRPIAGRTFSRAYAADSLMRSLDGGVAPDGNILINMSAVHALGFASPGEALGKTLRIQFGPKSEVTIIGVIPDVNFTSLKEPVAPEAYLNLGPIHSTLTVAFDTDDYAGFVQKLKDIWAGAGATRPMDYVLISENWNLAYRSDRLAGDILAAFSLLAVLIAAAGIYSLFSFEIEARMREIAMRKALGGSVADIVRLLLRHYSRPVLWGNAVAIPVAWEFSRIWLEGFTERIPLSPAYFIAALAVTGAVAWLAVGGGSYRAARQSPLFVLRYE